MVLLLKLHLANEEMASTGRPIGQRIAEPKSTEDKEDNGRQEV
jgi:hypothetical protein